MQISVLLCSRVGEYLSFIDPPLGGFGGILPEVMIFSSDDIFQGLCPEENIITSGNIPPNPQSGGSMIYYTES